MFYWIWAGARGWYGIRQRRGGWRIERIWEGVTKEYDLSRTIGKAEVPGNPRWRVSTGAGSETVQYPNEYYTIQLARHRTKPKV